MNSGTWKLLFVSEKNDEQSQLADAFHFFPLNFEIVFVYNTEEAVFLLKETDFDLIILLDEVETDRIYSSVGSLDNPPPMIVMTSFTADFSFFEKTANLNIYRLDRSVFPLNALPGLAAYAVMAEKRFEEYFSEKDSVRQEGGAAEIFCEKLNCFFYRIRNDDQGNFEYIKGPFYDITGYTPDEALTGNDISFRDLVTPDEWQKLHDSMLRASEKDRRFQLVFRISTASGITRWLAGQGVCIYGDEGRVKGFEGINLEVTERMEAVDELIKNRNSIEKMLVKNKSELEKLNSDLRKEIVERKRVEEALKDSETKYRFLAENSIDIIWIYNIESKGIEFISPFVYDISGYTVNEIGNMKPENYLTEESYKKAVLLLKDELENDCNRNPRRTVRVEADYRIKNGLIRNCEVNAGFKRNSKGEPLAIFGTTRDITMRKETEKEVIRLNHELKKRIQDRTEELIKTGRALEESMEAVKQTEEKLILSEKMAYLGNIVASMAHEINTPLGIGITAVSNQEEHTSKIIDLFHVGKISKNELEQYFSVIAETTGILNSNLKRAAELMKSMKIIAVDQCSEIRRKINLKDYFNEIFLSLRPELKKTGHEVLLNCPANIMFKTYPGAISQIFINLILNSLKHGFEYTQNGKIVINLRRKDKSVEITYQDNGKGMDREHLIRLFEPYFTTKQGKGGSGLGMQIVHNLVVEKMGGQISCDSSPGKGFMCVIILPVDWQY